MLRPGSRLGPYEIESLLGKGGMGEVYRARDPRLGRDVAIKVLPSGFSADPLSRQRFEREARAIAALEHPNICPLYDVGEDSGTSFLVMQYLQGESLAQVLARGALPLERVIGYAVDVAAALDAAHRAGVVHRDLKPANILVTKSGVKLLDFGLARMSPTTGPVAAHADPLATESASLNEPGTLLGTLQYMAPEQLEGRNADARSDIFALGTVAIEMATGRKAFAASSQAGLIAAILKGDPPALSPQSAIPAALRRVVAKCLAKDPDLRWQSAGDLAEVLKWTAETESTAEPSVPFRVRRRAWMLPSLAAAALTAAIGLAIVSRPSPNAAPRVHFTVDPPPGAQLDPMAADSIALSPNGDRLVYVAIVNGEAQLFERTINDATSRPIAGTTGGLRPFFSRDGTWIGFSSRGGAKKIALSGGPPLDLRTNEVGPSAWGPNDKLVVPGGTRGTLQLIDAATGGSRDLTTLDAQNGETSHRLPSFVPGGTAVIFTAGPPRDGPWYEAQIAVQALGDATHRTLVRGGAQARYAPSGHLVYGRAGTLYAVPFDLDTLHVTADAVAVLENVLEDPALGSSNFAIANNGTLAYMSGGLVSSEIVWVDRLGRIARVLAGSDRRLLYQPRLSPDGARLAITVAGGNGDVWIYSVGSGIFSRLTSGANHLFPTWTPDGLRVAFTRTETRELLWQPADRSGPEEALLSTTETVPHSWSPDGRFLAVTERGAATGQDIALLDVERRSTRPLVATRFTELSPMISPDGQWLAYASDESGRFQIYVQAFPEGGERWQISRDGGTEPLWARDGTELYFRHGAQLMAAPAVPPFGNARVLFELSWWALRFSSRTQYDVAPDGQGFLMLRQHDWDVPPRIHVILNWAEELKQRVPRP